MESSEFSLAASGTDWSGAENGSGIVFREMFTIEEEISGKTKEKRTIYCQMLVCQWPDGKGGFEYAARVLVGCSMAADRNFPNAQEAKDWLAVQKDLLLNPPAPKVIAPAPIERTKKRRTQVVEEEGPGLVPENMPSESAHEPEGEPKVVPLPKVAAEVKPTRKRGKKKDEPQTEEELRAEIARLESQMKEAANA